MLLETFHSGLNTHLGRTLSMKQNRFNLKKKVTFNDSEKFIIHTHPCAADAEK